MVEQWCRNGRGCVPIKGMVCASLEQKGGLADPCHSPPTWTLFILLIARGRHSQTFQLRAEWGAAPLTGTIFQHFIKTHLTAHRSLIEFAVWGNRTYVLTAVRVEPLHLGRYLAKSDALYREGSKPRGCGACANSAGDWGGEHKSLSCCDFLILHAACHESMKQFMWPTPEHTLDSPH
jgi:hypothetical protein